MFGLTEKEMNLYKDLAQDFAVRDVTPIIISKAKVMTPLVQKGDNSVPDMEYVKLILHDIETIITITAAHMAYDYAYLQAESDKKEEEIIKHLHEKYDNYLFTQFIRYGLAHTLDVISEIIGEIILELPYLYISVIEDENFDEDTFLEEKMDAYERYLEENFPDYEEEEEEEDEDEGEEVELEEEDE